MRRQIHKLNAIDMGERCEPKKNPARSPQMRYLILGEKARQYNKQ